MTIVAMLQNGSCNKSVCAFALYGRRLAGQQNSGYFLRFVCMCSGATDCFYEA